jgi:large subunit ribosomal protein L3
MAKFILGKKEKMTEFFSPEGEAIPVTVISAEPVTVVRILEKEKDGYAAIQVGYGRQKKERLSQAQMGQMKGNPYRVLKEFRLKPADFTEVKEGEVIDMSIFTPGEKLQVSSLSKGKGFQGVVKRHGFHGGPRTHGQKHSEREPGSIGGGLRTRVPKKMRMAGRMGAERITQKNLEVVLVDKENNLLFLRGAVAGRRGTLVEIVSRS